MAVKKTRSLTFSDHHPRYGNLSINDLDEFTAGLAGGTTVKTEVSIIKADRPGESDQVSVTLSVEE